MNFCYQVQTTVVSPDAHPSSYSSVATTLYPTLVSISSGPQRIQIQLARGNKCNSLTQQFIGISTTIDTWATCFDSYRVIFTPSKNTDPILQGSQVHCGIPNAYIVVYYRRFGTLRRSHLQGTGSPGTIRKTGGWVNIRRQSGQ